MNIFNYNNELELSSLTTILIGNGAFKETTTTKIFGIRWEGYKYCRSFIFEITLFWFQCFLWK